MSFREAAELFVEYAMRCTAKNHPLRRAARVVMERVIKESTEEVQHGQG